MNTRVAWRHDNELGWRPEIDGPVRVAPDLQPAWSTYYGYAGADRNTRHFTAGEYNKDLQSLWDRSSDRATPSEFSVGGGGRNVGFKRPRLRAFSPYDK